jgi:predicted peptidase
MGATGAWHYILTRPQMFAAAIPVCGGGNPDIATKIINVPVWTFQSGMEKMGVEYTRDMVEAIKNAGGNPLYTEFSDLNHRESCIQAFYTPGLLDWLFSQKLD